MNILVVDDERLVLAAIRESVEAVSPGQPVACFGSAEDALCHARQNPVDVALLDIELGGMSGLDLALRLKAMNGKTNVIFVTGYSDYMGNALSMHASGYILKPARTEDIAREFENLRYPPEKKPEKRIRARCFGNFEVYVDGRPLPFTHAKAREILGYLVYKNGSSVSKREIAAALWEDKPYTRSLQYQIQKSVSQLEKVLEGAGAGGMLERYWGRISVNTGTYSSDYSDFLNGDVGSLNAYNGEYMAEYSWAEFTAGALTQAAQRKNDGG